MSYYDVYIGDGDGDFHWVGRDKNYSAPASLAALQQGGQH